MQPTISIDDPWQDQLNQRMQLAKQQGWSDADIQRSAAVETAMHQQQLSAQTQQADTQQANAAAKPKTSGRGGFLTSLISELGGAGGAAAGAAAGTAILPGVGTIIGAGLGGLLGGAGGSAVEQEVRNGTVNTGSALKEGALDGLFGAGGEALSAGKLALQASKAAKTSLSPVAANLFAEAAPDATQAGTRVPGVLQNIGNDITTNALGIAQGAGSGASKIGANESQNLLGTLKTLGVSLGSPEATQASLESKMSTLGTALQSAYKNASSVIPVSQADVQNLATGILQKVSTMGGLTDADRNYALGQAQSLVNNGGDLNQLWNFTKDVESRINFGRNAASGEPGTEMVNNTIKGDVRDFLNAKVPGAADLNNAYSNASTANSLLINATTNAKGGLTQRALSLSPVKAVETKAGQALTTAGKFTAGTGTGTITAPLSQVTRQGVRQIPGNMATTLSDTNQTAQQDATQQNAVTQAQSAATAAGSAAPFANATTPDQQVLNAAAQNGASSFSDFSNALSMTDQAGLTGPNAGSASAAGGLGGVSSDNPDSLVQSALQALANGDTKSYSTLMSAATALQTYQQKAASAASSATPSLNATQQKAVTSTQAAISLLGLYNNQIDSLTQGSSGNIATGTIDSLIGKYIPGAPQSDKNAAALSSGARDVAIQIATAISGGLKPQIGTIQQVQDSLPSINDSPSLRQAKISALQSRLQDSLSIYGTPVSQLTGQQSSNDPTDELASLLSTGAY